MKLSERNVGVLCRRWVAAAKHLALHPRQKYRVLSSLRGRVGVPGRAPARAVGKDHAMCGHLITTYSSFVFVRRSIKGKIAAFLAGCPFVPASSVLSGGCTDARRSFALADAACQPATVFFDSPVCSFLINKQPTAPAQLPAGATLPSLSPAVSCRLFSTPARGLDCGFWFRRQHPPPPPPSPSFCLSV